MAAQTVDISYEIHHPDKMARPVLWQANLPGTGGVFSREYLSLREDIGYAIPNIIVIRTPTQNKEPLNVRDLVTRIRESINLSITEFASVCGVTRQAVYKWLSDDPPLLQPENTQKLESLDAARRILKRADVVATPWILDRRIVNGKTFLENQRDGYSAAEWAEKVVAVLQEESRTRKRMDEELGDRLKKADEIVEWGIPMLSESID